MCPSYSDKGAPGEQMVEWDYIYRYAGRTRQQMQQLEAATTAGDAATSGTAGGAATNGDAATAHVQSRHRSRVFTPATEAEALAAIAARVREIAAKRSTDRLGVDDRAETLQPRPKWRPDIESGDLMHMAMLQKIYSHDYFK